MKSIDPGELPALLESSIREVAGEADVRAELPEKLFHELRDRGAFRLLTPREYGGFEASLTTVLDVYERLGRIDASVAWTVWNANWGFLAALLDEKGADRLWAGDAEPIFANSGSPGVAVPIDNWYRVSGRWKIVSGIASADWLAAVAVVMEGSSPREAAPGVPDVRVFAVHRDQLSIEHTWDVTGMRGTGSEDVVVQDALVPEELSARFDVPARLQRPPYRTFIPALVLPGCTAVVLGVARAAIEETVALAATKKSMTGGLLADSARVQTAVARAETELRAARLLLMSVAGAFDAASEKDEEVTLMQRADLRAAMSHAARVCRDVLVSMYQIGSSTSLYRANPVERLFRDGMAALQHANHSADFLEAAGRVRLGREPGLPLF
ncbi:acyl-CoA dehydrogenase family protein [Streptomyces sp. NPDC013178]|uniref:acyl-CoA dehydrogenase family protein n=1 Tax=Streptomyces sp. NPDC013178 TaxID=3155118 RepID=UPI0033E79209